MGRYSGEYRAEAREGEPAVPEEKAETDTKEDGPAAVEEEAETESSF
jgi:hypothetical protein